jgi:NitT/TauT family transport system permease protein
MAIDVTEEVDGAAETVGSGLGDIDTRRARRGFGGIAVFLLLWTGASLTQPSYVLPTPFAVATTFYEQTVSGEVFVALGNSILHWIPGAVLGTGLGSRRASRSPGARTSTT